MPDSEQSVAEPQAGPAGRAATSVCAVVITYHPDRMALTALIEAVKPQVDTLVIVDNASPAGRLAGIAPPSTVLLAQRHNVGLARAQNIGIDWAREHGHSHVLLLDQDSVPQPRMVAELLAAHKALSGTRKVAAVGPRYRDSETGEEAPFIRVAFPMSRKLSCEGVSYVESDFLISSGVLIPIAVLDDVGGMDDGLFIDNVDMEWSFRARAKGYLLYGVCAATMEHRLGEARKTVLGGRLTIVTHAPVRLYFIMRNRIALYRLKHTPRVWVAQDLPRVLVKFFFFSALVGPRVRNVRYMLRGLADGVHGRSGPCSLERP